MAALGVVALVAAAPAQAIGSYADPAGDSGTAGDVTHVEVESDNASGQIVFRVSGSNLSTAPNQLTFLDIDSDANPLTGNTSAWGIDYFFGIDDESYGFFHWSGTDWAATPDSTVMISGRGSGLLISINRRELSNTSDFNFDLFTVNSTDPSAGDDAPTLTLPNATEFAVIQRATTIVWPTMYCGVPKNRATRSAARPNVSWPNAP